jgi:hypothetical protein
MVTSLQVEMDVTADVMGTPPNLGAGGRAGGEETEKDWP